MSEEERFGLNFMEKLFGLILSIVGIFTIYYTYINSKALANFAGLFGGLSLVMFILGLILVISKTD